MGTGAAAACVGAVPCRVTPAGGADEPGGAGDGAVRSALGLGLLAATEAVPGIDGAAVPHAVINSTAMTATATGPRRWVRRRGLVRCWPGVVVMGGVLAGLGQDAPAALVDAGGSWPSVPRVRRYLTARTCSALQVMQLPSLQGFRAEAAARIFPMPTMISSNVAAASPPPRTSCSVEAAPDEPARAPGTDPGAECRPSMVCTAT